MSQSAAMETVFDDESMHVGQVYAKALLAAAQAEGNVDLVIDQLESLVEDVLAKQPELVAFLGNPKAAIDDKIALLDRVFGTSMNR